MGRRVRDRLAGMGQIVDAFPHILPKDLFERMCTVAETPAAQSWLAGSRRQTTGTFVGTEPAARLPTS